ncbi:MAG TPA: ATP-binding domain-containing protein [Streptosporangiaceae bacterium]|nr:ATP-binding domain-containing protein [Streptosporangiaceae bacterium]
MPSATQPDSKAPSAGSARTGEPGSDRDRGGDDPVLAAERAHLRGSREFLRLMRDDVLSLRALVGDRVSEEYLKADLHRRAEALTDLPDTPLFFGRLDYADSLDQLDDPGDRGALAGERFHIGRRHVHDPDGRPVVIDWRAPVSRPFYRASPAEPMGLALRRRFGFSGGELTAYEDEDFTGHTATGPATSRILIEEIERPRSGPMRDIVATIQPDQDDIVRAAADQTVCVQGAPGTGKTAVGLHRVAYLLYAFPERMRRGGVLVVGPNRAFLAYIRNVLPALGELDVTQLSVTDLLTTVPVRAVDPERAARTKGDARMAEVLRRALWQQLAEPANEIMLARGSRRWRVPAGELAALVDELRSRGVRYGTGREMLSHRIAHVILTRMEAAGETCDDRTHEAVRRTRPVRDAVDAIWPKGDPVRLVFRLLSDPGLLAIAGSGLLQPDEQAAISWGTAPRGPGSARWSAADMVLIDEARDLIERTPSLAHVVVDEAQDLSPMQCRAIGRRCATGSATVLGDIAQGTTPWATASWAQLLAHLGKGDAGLRVLDTGYRVPRQILDFASSLLGHIAPGLTPASSVRQDPGSLVITAATLRTLPGALAAACADALTRPGSVAVIAADDQVPGLSGILRQASLAHAVLDGDSESQQLAVVPVTLAKGLEFDQVIVVEPGRIAAAESRGLHRLYVALTRAVSRLTVLHAEPLPAPLR